MPSVNSLRDAAKSSHTLQLSEVPLCRAGKCHAHHFAGGELVCGRFGSPSHIALAELNFETQIVSQRIFGHRTILLPWMLAFLVLGDSYETLITNQRNNPSNVWPQRDTEVGGKKGGSSLWMCKRRDVVRVQMWYQHRGTQLFLTLPAFLTVLEKWAVKLCNRKKKLLKFIHRV